METKNLLIETAIVCQVYKPMVGLVMYAKDEIGIPQVTDPEVEAEMGWKYTIVSPLSPYAVGKPIWQKLCEMAGDLALSDAFTTEVNFNTNRITIYKKE